MPYYNSVEKSCETWLTTRMQVSSWSRLPLQTPHMCHTAFSAPSILFFQRLHLNPAPSSGDKLSLSSDASSFMCWSWPRFFSFWNVPLWKRSLGRRFWPSVVLASCLVIFLYDVPGRSIRVAQIMTTQLNSDVEAPGPWESCKGRPLLSRGAAS